MSRVRPLASVPWTILAFVFFLVVAFDAWSIATAAERSPNGRALARARQARKRNTGRLLSLKHVVGAATGLTRDGSFAVKVYTRRANVVGIPQRLDGVPVVVEIAGEFFALRQPIRRPRQPIRRPRWPYRHPRRGRRGNPPSDNPPSVVINTPSDGEIVSGQVTVTASAFDDVGVADVAFLVDGLLVGLDLDPADGWSVQWDTTTGFGEGSHQLTATATDTVGQTGADSLTVFVDNDGSGLLSPAGRPAPIGVSTGNGNECSAGTIGCRVSDAEGNVYALSNNHVYARLNRAELGEAILQPGLIDSDCVLRYSDQAIGYLADFVPIDFSGEGSNVIDAAIAVCSPEDLGVNTPDDVGYGTPKSAPVAAYVDQLVQKYGRTSLLTMGYVSAIEATVIVNYGDRNATFMDQIIVSGNAGTIFPGDSGSLLVQQDLSPVGLLFAGNDDGSMAVANPIQPVLDAFGVVIDGD